MRYLLDLDIYNIIKKICINIKIESIFNCICLYSVNLLQHRLLNELCTAPDLVLVQKYIRSFSHLKNIPYLVQTLRNRISLSFIHTFFFISLHPVYLVFFVSFSLLESFCFAFCLFPCYYYYLLHHSLHLLFLQELLFLPISNHCSSH